MVWSVLCRLTSRERKKGKRMVCECQFDPGMDDMCTSLCAGGER